MMDRNPLVIPESCLQEFRKELNEVVDHTLIDELLRHKKLRNGSFNVKDLWDQKKLASTYWILLMLGIDQAKDVSIAKNLLFWREVSAKDSARVQCILTSERNCFRFCVEKFRITECPVLILGTRPELPRFIRLDAQILAKLIEDESGFQRFLTYINNAVENGTTLEQLAYQLRTQKLLDKIKLIYSEAKSWKS